MSRFAESLDDSERYAELVRMLRPDYPFMQLSYHLGEKAEPTSRTSRVLRDGKHLIKKEYLGKLAEKSEHEIELLMGVASHGLQHTAAFKTINARTCILATDNQSKLEILMKNYGLDLDDWFFLFQHSGCKYLNSPYFHLAIFHFILLAMKELHQANFVLVDVKSDNICIALPSIVESILPNTSDRIALQFDLTTLTLIDLGEALHPDPNKRSLLFHSNGMPLGPSNDYISRQYIKRKALVKPHDMSALRRLDWRVDFYALGCLVEDWILCAPLAAAPPAYLNQNEVRNYRSAIDLLYFLPIWLKGTDTDPSTDAGNLPHDTMIERIGKVLDVERWKTLELALPRSIGGTRFPTAQISVANDTLLEKSSTLSRQETDRRTPVPSVPAERMRRKGRRIAKSNLEAVTWYGKQADKFVPATPSVDLMC